MRILFFGNESEKAYKPNPFYKKQVKNLKDIWENKTYNDFGIERIFRIILQLLAFIIPSSLVRQFSGINNLINRKLIIEFWGISKLVYYYFILLEFDKTRSKLFLIISIILTFDTLHFLISRIFLNDVFRQAISYKRSLMMTFINYAEICMCYAFIYAYIDHTNTNIENTIFIVNSKITNLQAIYFSFVTSATIGYGDIAPKNPFVMKIVISQIIISLFLVVVIISNVTTKIEDKTFYNKE